MTRRRALAALLLALSGTGAIAASADPTADARGAWARVLARHVTEEGSIDFDALRAAPRDLERYVAWAARNGPRSTPGRFATASSRLAYYLDTYNALAMWNVVRGRFEPRQKIRFFHLTRLEVDGETRSLASLENDVIRPFGDPRVHFALNCMVRSCPRLPREPWSAERLDEQLDAATRRFLNERRNVELIAARKVVRLSSLLDFYPEDFLAEAPSLVAYVNRHRSEAIPSAYEVEFIPYDWTLNRASRAVPR